MKASGKYRATLTVFVVALEKQNVLNFSIMEVLQTYLPSYPDRPVSVGDSWKEHKRTLIPF
jgi:hypothetical protein